MTTRYNRYNAKWYLLRRHDKPSSFMKLPASFFDVGVRDGVLVFHDIRVGDIISLQELMVVFKDLSLEEKTTIRRAFSNFGVLNKLSKRGWNEEEIDLHD